MPTVTMISTARITNFGPLTTTYTAPASCATETDRLYFADDSDHPEYPWANPTCTMQLYGKCIPSGDQYDHLITATYAKTFDLGFYHYYSPGLYCPSDWTTAGGYVRGTGSIGQMSGELTKTTESAMVPEGWEPGRPFRMDPASVWIQVLEPSETLAVCCPSNYTLNFNGDCYSVLGPLSTYGYSEICGFILASTAVPVTRTRSGHELLSYTEPPPLETITRDMQTGERFGDSLVVTKVPAVALIHKKSGFTKTSGGDDTKENSANRMSGCSCAMLLLTVATMATIAISGF